MTVTQERPGGHLAAGGAAEDSEQEQAESPGPDFQSRLLTQNDSSDGEGVWECRLQSFS